MASEIIPQLESLLQTNKWNITSTQ